MMFTIHQKRFSFLKKAFISFYTNGANRPGVNRPVRKMVLERIVPGGTGFGANRPVTHCGMLCDFSEKCLHELQLSAYNVRISGRFFFTIFIYDSGR